MRLKLIQLAVVITLGLVACRDSTGGSTDSFDRPAMLAHYADQLIQPRFTALDNQVDALALNWQAFQLAPSPEMLEGLRQNWTLAFGRWQAVNAFNFGPAGEAGLRKNLLEEIATFPANTAKIEEFVASGDTTLNNFNRDTRGFLALEYLLFDETNGSLLDSEPRRVYFDALIRHLQLRVAEINTRWPAYRAEFLAASGTDAGSSTSQLYNEWVRSFEALKNFKVGLPLGKRPGQTQPEPQLVEAYYSGKSLEMLKLHVQSIENIYYGRGNNGQNGPGFKNYLDAVVGGSELVVSTEAQWQKVKDALAAVPTDRPLSELMASNDPTLETLNTELQKQTRFFKSDLSSLLGLAITFSSGDGD